MRWFADNQPSTPITETVRGLLMGTPMGSSAGITLFGYLWPGPSTTAIPPGRPG